MLATDTRRRPGRPRNPESEIGLAMKIPASVKHRLHGVRSALRDQTGQTITYAQTITHLLDLYDAEYSGHCADDNKS